MVSGRLGAAGVVGLLQGVVCSVIPAGSPRVPVCRPRALPVPREAPFRGRPLRPFLPVDGPRSAGSFPLPARRWPLPPSRSVRPVCGRAAGPPPHGVGQPGTHGPGAVAGASVGEGRPAGGRSRGLEGVPAPAAVARRLAWCLEAACGGKVAPRGKGRRLAVDASVGCCWPRCVWGLVRPRRPLWRRALGDCRGAKVGAWAVRRTRARVPVWRWGLRSVSVPLLSPRPGLPPRARPPSFLPRWG